MGPYFFVYAILTIVLLVVIFTYIRKAYKNHNIKKKLISEFGKRPDIHYEGDDLLFVGEYHSFKLNHGYAGFTVDNITWNDLSMDQVFMDINSTQTSCGEQALYDILRTPVFTRKEFDERDRLIELLDKNEALRIRLQLIFTRLGRQRNVDICSAFEPEKHGAARFIIYTALAFGFTVSAVLSIISPMTGVMWLMPFLIVNVLTYTIEKRKVENELVNVNYLLSMISTAKSLKKLNAPEIAENIAAMDEAFSKLKALAELGSITMTANDLNDLFGFVFLWDLIRYEFSKHRLSAYYRELMTIHEAIGNLDSAVAIASYRHRLKLKCHPQIDFDSTNAYIEAEGIVHPLIKKPVPNSFSAHGSMLLTGSNASGKSTFLKTAALSALLAQTICVCTAQSYRSAALRIYSSMALRDDLAAGESYYIVEIKSIKRIIDATDDGKPILCIVDEVLRGTNTIERIAASAEILRHIAQRGALCFAATHDIELSSILRGEYVNRHFQEYIKNNEMTFDYKLHDGPSTSRNAIKLLEIMGYDKSISQAAEQSAQAFLNSERWGKPEHC